MEPGPQNNALSSGLSNSFIGAGVGMALETRAGIFNISFAAGKRNDVDLNLRQSKIHFGYINFFWVGNTFPLME